MKQKTCIFTLVVMFLLSFSATALAQNVAKIGETEYETLAAAIEGATADATITLLADMNITESTTIGKNITFDLNGHSISETVTDQFGAIYVKKGATLTIMATNGGEITTDGGIVIGNYGTVIVEGGTINAADDPEKDVSIYNFYYQANYYGTMTINGGTVDRIWNCGVATLAGGTITDVDNSGAMEIAEDATVTNIILKDGSHAPEVPNAGKLTGAANLRMTMKDGFKAVYDNGVWTATTEPEGAVAHIGETYYYTSLAAALGAAKTGETVTLDSDIAASEIIIINKAITLDGNDKILTSSAGRAINVSGADGVTIKDLTINASGERAINVIQNATNVTIDNVTATAANYTVNVASSAPNAVVAINNSTLNGLCTVNVSAEGAQVTVDNSTVNCDDNNTTVGESYAALCLNKEAIGGSIVATNSTINVADDSDSMKGRNGAENGTVTINGSADDVTVMVAVITYEGSPYYYSFETLADAIEFAKAGDVVTLIRNIEVSEIITINKAITLDLNDKKVTSTVQKAFEVHANATIKNGAIEAVQRCVDTRTAVELTLTDVELVATSTKYSNPQPLTIGGSDNGTEVTMENVEINAGTAGYGIITFVETELTATNSTIGGYNALYVKPGSDNSTFNFVNSDLSGGNIGNDVEGNSFSTIAVRANNVAVNVDAESTVTASGNYYYAISFKSSSQNEAATGSSVTVAGEITGNILAAPNGNTVMVKAEYADELAAAGYATIEAENGLVAVKPAAKIGDVYYETLADAIEFAKAGDVVTLIRDITASDIITIDKAITLDGNGKTLTSTSCEFPIAVSQSTEVNVENCDLTYTRELDQPNTWYALYVPFAIDDIPEGYQVAEFTAVNSGSITVSLVESVEANTPYVIRRTEEAESIEISVTEAIFNAGTSELGSLATLTGVYTETVASAIEGAYAMSKGAFVQAIEPTQTLKPFRFYLTLNPSAAAFGLRSISVNVDGEDEGLTAIDSELFMTDDAETEVYDIQGRRVENPSKGGIYIVGDKKVVIK